MYIVTWCHLYSCSRFSLQFVYHFSLSAYHCKIFNHVTWLNKSCDLPKPTILLGILISIVIDAAKPNCPAILKYNSKIEIDL